MDKVRRAVVLRRTVDPRRFRVPCKSDFTAGMRMLRLLVDLRGEVVAQVPIVLSEFPISRVDNQVYMLFAEDADYPYGREPRIEFDAVENVVGEYVTLASCLEAEPAGVLYVLRK